MQPLASPSSPAATPWHIASSRGCGRSTTPSTAVQQVTHVAMEHFSHLPHMPSTYARPPTRTSSHAPGRPYSVVSLHAGCATGLAIGWSGGPASALQSCVGIGLLSYVVDLGGTEQAAKASCCGGCSAGGSGVCASGRDRHSHHHEHRHEGIKMPAKQKAGLVLRAPRPGASPLNASLLQDLPPVMWLGAVSGGASGYFDPSPWAMVEA